MRRYSTKRSSGDDAGDLNHQDPVQGDDGSSRGSGPVRALTIFNDEPLVRYRERG